MRNFAQLDGDNVVTTVMVCSDDVTETGFLESLGGTFAETFDDGTRKNFAGIGYLYDSVRDAFIPPKPYNSWLLNETTCQWNAPTPMPETGMWRWDEDTTAWVEIVVE